jgi:hypothetical protein
VSATISRESRPPARIAARAAWAVSDGLAAAERLLTKLRHDTTAMAMTLGAPVILVLVFGYIFGSAIAVPGRGNYREYLVPGLFVMIAANIIPSMVTMARDADLRHAGLAPPDRQLEPGQRPGRRNAAPVRQPVRSGQWGVAAGTPGHRVPGMDRAAAGPLRPALHRPLRPLVKGSFPGTKHYTMVEIWCKIIWCGSEHQERRS